MKCNYANEALRKTCHGVDMDDFHPVFVHESAKTGDTCSSIQSRDVVRTGSTRKAAGVFQHIPERLSRQSTDILNKISSHN